MKNNIKLFSTSKIKAATEALNSRPMLRNIVIVLVLMVMCILWLGYILVHGDRQIQKTDYWVNHTYKTILESENISALTEAMLASQRAYIMTGQEKFLDEYNIRKSQVSDLLANISELVSTNKSQSSRVQEMRQLFRDLTIRLEERSRLYKPVGVPEGFINEVDVVSGVKNDILKINGAILREEHTLLNNRINLMNRKKDDYFYMICIGGIMTAMLIIIFNVMLFYAQNRRLNAEQSLKDTEERFALSIRMIS